MNSPASWISALGPAAITCLAGLASNTIAEEQDAPLRLDVRAPAAHVRHVVSLIERNDPQQFVNLLNRNLQKYADVEALGRRFAMINRRLGPLADTDWESLTVANAEQHPRVKGRLRFENGEVDAEFIYGRFNKLLGLRLRGQDFVCDTLDALKDVEAQQQHAENYWRLLFAGEAEKAYELFITEDSRRVLPKEQYLRLVGPFSEAMRDSHIENIQLHAVRVKQPTEEGEYLSIQVYHLIELNGRRYNSARMTYEMNGDRFQGTKFDTANFDDSYPVYTSVVQERFFRALVSGDARQVIELIHPADRGAVNPAVLQAFLTACEQKLGGFRSVKADTFSAETTYRRGYRSTDASCLVEFQHATVPVSTKHGVGWLESFNAQTGFSGWTKGLKDTSTFEQHGKKFLTELIIGDAHKAVRMLPGDLRKDVGEEQMKRIQDACKESLGAVKSIDFSSKEHLAEDDVWRMNYKISTEKQQTTGYVDYDFNAFDGRVFGFRVRFPNDE